MNDSYLSGVGTACRCLLIAAGLATTPVARAVDLSSFSEDFESLNQTSPTALNHWKIYANVFSPDHSTYFYGYGPFPGSNGTPGFSAVTTGQGGPAQGVQGLVVYSDYNNSAQAAGNQVEANFFQETLITEADLGTHVFRFDAKAGDLISPSKASAFIRVLDPVTFVTFDFLSLDTTALPVGWGTYSISIEIDEIMVGQLIQFGFSATASNYVASGVYYDNVTFGIVPPAPPVITGITKTGNVVSVNFPTEINSTYDLFKSTDGMITFNPVLTQPAINGDGTSKVATDNSATEPSAFYRIRRVQ